MKKKRSCCYFYDGKLLLTRNIAYSNREKHSGPNKIQVSSQKSPKFYSILAKKFLSSHQDVEISGLGSAISTAVSTAAAGVGADASAFGWTLAKAKGLF